jgi:hypothetical protein
MAHNDYAITVSCKELAEALAIVTIGIRKGTSSDARFSVADGFLDIMGPGATHSIEFRGTWPSAVLVDASLLKTIASRLPQDDPLSVRVENSRIFFGGFSIGAKVLDIAPEAVQLPIGASGPDICLAIARMGEVIVVGSIGKRAVENAKEELLQHIDQAVRALGVYGVTRADVDAVRALQQKATKSMSGP